MVNLVATIPPTYPESALPIIDIEILKGLSPENKVQLLTLANEEAHANMGMAAIFACCEVVREWLADNNVKGLDDASMHAQMMRKAKEVERREVSLSYYVVMMMILICCCLLIIIAVCCLGYYWGLEKRTKYLLRKRTLF